MLSLALMSVVPILHLPMLERRQYHVRQSQGLCIGSCQELYHSVFFSFYFFITSGFENELNFGQFQSE